MLQVFSAIYLRYQCLLQRLASTWPSRELVWVKSTIRSGTTNWYERWDPWSSHFMPAPNVFRQMSSAWVNCPYCQSCLLDCFTSRRKSSFHRKSMTCRHRQSPSTCAREMSRCSKSFGITSNPAPWRPMSKWWRLIAASQNSPGTISNPRYRKCTHRSFQS